MLYYAFVVSSTVITIVSRIKKILIDTDIDKGMQSSWLSFLQH